MNANPKELLREQIDMGFTKEEAIEIVREEISSRHKISSLANIKVENDYVASENKYAQRFKYRSEDK